MKNLNERFYCCPIAFILKWTWTEFHFYLQSPLKFPIIVALTLNPNL